MRQLQIIVAIAVVVSLTAAGCGGSSAPANQTPIRPLPLNITLSTVGLPPQTQPDLMSLLPARNTCDGADTWLPFKWSAIPSGTAELALFIVNIKPVKEALFVDWAVGGLSPSSNGISAGTLPPGAVVGRNSFGQVGYSICPPKGTSEVYVARLVALSHPLDPQSGFDGKTFYLEAERAGTAVGLTGAGRYAR
jgi:phosphatidylethanolamine-binding protein (PEBP) family uncharacterized protein